MWRKENTHPLLFSVHTYTITMEISLTVPQNMRTELPQDPSMPPIYGQTPKGHFIKPKRNLPNHAHFYCTHNIPELEIT